MNVNRTKRTMHGLLFLSFAVALGLAACGGRIATTDEPPEAGAPDTARPTASADGEAPPLDASADVCVDAIGEEVTDHSCVHGTEGPFDTVVLADSIAGAPDTSRLHVAYRLTSPMPKGEGYVAYVPARGGEHVFYAARARVVAVSKADGTALSALHLQRAEGCASFDSAAVFALEEGATYAVRLALEEPSAVLFFEHMGSFGSPWARRCGDR